MVWSEEKKTGDKFIKKWLVFRLFTRPNPSLKFHLKRRELDNCVCTQKRREVWQILYHRQLDLRVYWVSHSFIFMSLNLEFAWISNQYELKSCVCDFKLFFFVIFFIKNLVFLFLFSLFWFIKSLKFIFLSDFRIH